MLYRFYVFGFTAFAFFLFSFPPLVSSQQIENVSFDSPNNENYFIAQAENNAKFKTSLFAQNETPPLEITIQRTPQDLNTTLDTSLLTTRHKPIIKVGYIEGMTIIGDSTSYANKGYGYDLLQKFGDFANIDFEFVEIKGSLSKAVQDGIVDIAGLHSMNEERKDILFSKMPVHFVQYALTTKGDQNIFYDDPQSIDGKTVATFEGNPGNIFLDKYLKEHNISVQYIYGSIYDYQDLETDFYLFPSIKRTDEHFSSVLNLELRNLYFFSKLGNEQLLNYLDRKLYEFFIENVSFPRLLADKYLEFGNEFQNRSLRREEATLFEGKTFRVGYSNNHAPYQYENALGEPAGVSIDFMNNLAKEYGFHVEYVPFDLEASWSEFEDLDILISLIGERNHIARFYEGTDPYTSFDLNIVFQENYAKEDYSNESQYGLPENAQVGLINYINFKYSDFFADYPAVKIMHYTNTQDLIDAFLAKEVEAIIATNLGTATVASTIAVAKFQNSLNIPLALNFQISKKISDEYLQLFNIIINKEPKSTINNIIARQTAEHLPSFGSEQFIRRNLKYILIAAGFLSALLFALILIIRQRSTLSILAKDDVTNLKSLSQFTTEVNQSLSKAELNEYEMILLDIDYFRMINNYYGTDQGTKVIQAMASALSEAYKGFNVIMTRRIAEQFLIYKKVEEGLKIKDVVNSYLAPSIKAVVGESYSLKMSIAYCMNSEEGELMNDLLDNVNIAHQEAKKSHSTSFVEFNEDMRKKSSQLLNIIYRMEHAIKNKEFKVHYQPKVAFNSLNIIGAEALVRWIPPIGEPIYPSSFIPIMEENGFISQLEIYVFEEVCAFIQKNRESFASSKIAINVSPITLSKKALIKQMVELLKQYKISPSQIEIEITESAIGAFEETLPTIISILHKIGFSVAMDDFGAGNSSLNRLSVIEVDVLKLDKVFLDFHEDSRRGSMVVQQVIQLAKELGMKIVAEGIEKKEQAKWLKEIDCDIAQGYYFAKPLKETDFIELINKNKNFTL